MSSESDSSEEDEREYQRHREQRRRMKPWERRIQKCLAEDGPCTADEILAISEFFAPIPEGSIEVSLWEALSQEGHRLPAAEMKKLCDWWHGDPEKRRKLNKMLSIYHPPRSWFDHPGDGWDKKTGPEHKLAKGWLRLNAEQRDYLRPRVDPILAWDGIVESDNAYCPCDTWPFIDEFVALIDKHLQQAP